MTDRRTDTDPIEFMPDPVPESFAPTPMSVEEINKLILSLQDKPSNVNSIPIFVYKILSPIISSVIRDIFNLVIREGCFPALLKIAKIIPLHKGKRTKLLIISGQFLFCQSFSKLIEKLMKNRVLKFIDDNTILFNGQYGIQYG